MVTDRERAAVLALVNVAGRDWEWYRIAQAVADAGSALRLIDGEWSGFESEDTRGLKDVAAAARADISRYEELIREQRAGGAHCITVLDEDYPANLRAIYNPPPFLFVRGSLSAADERSIAIVGTRRASAAGLEQARWLASSLAKEGVTVLSGLARGIDTAAHRAALDVGGRTVAVMGTGINRRYPAENSELADEIERQGALVSQFWPDAPPTRKSFPMRNVVMSGITLKTVIVEASSTSGAKMQARLALEHGKLVFLIRSLVLGEEWAQSYVDKRGAIVVDDVADVLDRLVRFSKDTDFEQLKLG